MEPLCPKVFVLELIIFTLSLQACSPGIYKPSGNGPFPAAIVLHSGTGLKEYHLDFAADLSSKGYVTIAPEFCFNLRDCDAGDHSGHLRTIADAYDYLMTQPTVDRNRISMVGFSRGGAKAFSFSEHYPGKKLRAIVAYYPGPIRYIRFGNPGYPPILILQGELDEEAGSGWIKGFCSIQMEIGRVCDFKIYPGVYHAFNIPQTRRYGPPNPSAAVDAFERTINFLAKHVKGN